MPKEIADFRKFSDLIVEKAPKEASKKKKAPEHKPKTIFKKKLYLKEISRNGKKIIKLKLRTKGQLITHATKDEVAVKKLLSALPGTVEKIDLQNKAKQKKKAASK